MSAPGQASAGQAAYERAARLRDWDTMVDLLSWDSLPPEVQHIWEQTAQAGIDAFLAGDSVSAEGIREALAAREPDAAPELLLGPCPFEGHDGEHLRLNTHGHWLCAITLTNMLVTAGVITGLHPEPQPAPELAKVIQDWRDTLAELEPVQARDGDQAMAAQIDTLRTVIRQVEQAIATMPAPGPAARPGEALAADNARLRAIITEVLAWFGDNGSGRYARVSGTVLARAYAKSPGVAVPEELRRFL